MSIPWQAVVIQFVVTAVLFLPFLMIGTGISPLTGALRAVAISVLLTAVTQTALIVERRRKRRLSA